MELEGLKEIVNSIKDKEKDLMTSEEYKGKRILELAKQVRSLQRKIKIEEEHKKKLERLIAVNKLDELKNVDNLTNKGVFLDPNTPLDNEVGSLKNKFKKLTSELSMLRMEYQSTKSVYHKLIRLTDASFSYVLKNEDKFKRNDKKPIVNEKNFKEAIEYLINEDFGFKGTNE
eukprot:CAMPEP_0116913760 /NCGR_PEP_ID=MMETSP0467-20121206/16897_1 /TAXON_ID=283647 /ORGANISM="Mesodinium pulex, Strain SPMC105" /LENGTH=172 /DNA_ID=CAMNT_0004590039 /DNA_START=107 /DNA_END=625 /DNA_ORIENTATION=+